MKKIILGKGKVKNGYIPNDFYLGEDKDILKLEGKEVELILVEIKRKNK